MSKSRAAFNLPRDLAVVSRLVQHASGHPGTRRVEFTVLQSYDRGNISSVAQGSNEINSGRADFMIAGTSLPARPLNSFPISRLGVYFPFARVSDARDLRLTRLVTHRLHSHPVEGRERLVPHPRGLPALVTSKRLNPRAAPTAY